MDWTVFSFLVGTTLLPVAAGGHYHYATLSWERVGVGGSMGFETYVAGTHIVDITLRSAWSTEFSPYKDRSPGGVVSVGTTLRLTGTGNTVLYFGDGDESFESVNSRVLYVDDAIKSWRGEAVVRHAYPAAQRYRAYFSGCCRDAAVANSATGSFNVSTTIDLRLLRQDAQASAETQQAQRDYRNGFLTEAEYSTRLAAIEGRWTSPAASRSPQMALLPRQYLRERFISASENSFYVAAYDSAAHPNEAAAGRLSGRRHTWAIVPPPLLKSRLRWQGTRSAATAQPVEQARACSWTPRAGVYGAMQSGGFTTCG